MANAASPETGEKIRPGFIAILRQMAPDEASLLKLIGDVTDGHTSVLAAFKAQSKQALDRAIESNSVILMTRLRASFSREGEDGSVMDFRLQTCVRLLDNVGLLQIGDDIFLLSALGRTFLEFCCPPKSKV